MSSFWASVCRVHQTYGRNGQKKVEITSGLEQICSLKEITVCTVEVLEPRFLMQAVLGAGLPWPASFCLAAMPFQLLPVRCYLRTEQQLDDFREPWTAACPALCVGSSLVFLIP